MYSIVQHPSELVTVVGFEYLCMYFVIIGFTYVSTYFNVCVKILMVEYFLQCCLMKFVCGLLVESISPWHSMGKCVSSFLFYNPFDYKGEIEYEEEVDRLEHPKHQPQESNLLNFPYDLLSLIVRKLSMKDRIYFGVVCHSFRSIYKEEDSKQPRHQLPLLLVPTADNTATHGFYSIFYDSNFSEMPLDHKTFCRGSCYGWLITVKEDLTVGLLNPFLSQDNKIQLPPLTTFGYDDIGNYDSFLVKATISADPSSNPEDCVVMAIFGPYRRLAFCKPGDKTWTTLTAQVWQLHDIIYCRDKFHALSQDGELFVCDLNQDADPKMVRVSQAIDRRRGAKNYLVEVESTGDLMLISRVLGFNDEHEAEPERSFTTAFVVYKMDPDTGKWIEVHSLQGCAVFIGDNTSLSVRLRAADTHATGCIKPNTIWFTDDDFEWQYYVRERGYGPSDVGVFDLEDGTVQPTYPMNIELVAPPPIWIQPILC